MTDTSARHRVRAEVGIFGCYPPPFGGISMHVKRLLPNLTSAGVSWRVYNGVGEFADPPQIVNVTSRKLRSGLANLVHCPHPVCYVLSTQVGPRFWAGLMERRGRRVILHIDGASLHFAMASPRRRDRWMSRFAVRNVWGVVGVNESIREMASELRGSDERVWNIPAYLNPPATAPEPIDEPTQRFIYSHEPVLMAMGRFLEFKGSDLYGVALLVELLDRIRRRYPYAGLVCALTHPEDTEGPVWPVLKARIEELGLNDHLFIRPARGELVPLMDHCDLMVRPSYTDGDAVALREAIFKQLPAIASDAAPRPGGIVLHRTGDLDDLEAKTLEVLSDLPGARARLVGVDAGDTWPQLREVFAEALGREL